MKNKKKSWKIISGYPTATGISCMRTRIMNGPTTKEEATKRFWESVKGHSKIILLSVEENK
jgi:hypothetical protein